MRLCGNLLDLVPGVGVNVPGQFIGDEGAGDVAGVQVAVPCVCAGARLGTQGGSLRRNTVPVKRRVLNKTG